MLTELRTKSQVTIPKDITVKLGISEGDMLDIAERDGVITITPVAVYPKGYVDQLRAELDDVKRRVAKGEQPVFTSMDAMFDALDERGAKAGAKNEKGDLLCGV